MFEDQQGGSPAHGVIDNDVGAARLHELPPRKRLVRPLS
jgi:hypothetical protein